MEHFFLKQQTLGVLIFDPQTAEILAVNEQAEQILNKKAEIIVKNGIQFFLPKNFKINTSSFTNTGIIWEGFLTLNQEQLYISIFNDGRSGIVTIFQVTNLEQSQNHLLPVLRMVISSLDFDLIILDLEGNLKQLTKVFAQNLGYSDSELLCKNIIETLIPEHQKDYWQWFLKDIRRNRRILPMLQVQLKQKDGTVKPYLFNNSLLKDKAGEPVGTLNLCVDYNYLTDKIFQRGVSGQLEDIIAKISSMFAQSPTYKLDDCINETLKIVGEYAQVDRSYVFLFRENLKVMDNTHEWCAPGVEPQIQNLQGLPSKLFPWWMKYLLRNEIIHIPKVSALPKEAESEKEILEAQDIKSLIVVPMSEGENLIGFIGFDSVRRPKFWTNEDINLLKIVSSVFVSSLIRKNTELSLADTERRYRTLFSLAPDLLVILDLEGKIISLNPAFKKITGKEIEDVLKKPFSQLLIKEEQAEFERKLKICLKNEVPTSREYHLINEKGLSVIDLILVPMTERGKKVGTFGIGRDITERKSLEKNLQQAERLKSIGTLAGGIAHDFNNILEILLGNYSILKNTLPENEEINFSFDLIRQAIERGKNLVQNLLTFASKKDPQAIVLDLNSEVMHVVKLLQQTTPRAIYFNVKLSNKQIWVRFDRVQVHQMILNLCLNAIDAIKAKKPQGTIEISTKILNKNEFTADLNSQAKYGYCLLEIKDDGVGIEPEMQKFLFDPFFTTKTSGTGLGLSVVFGIVKSFGGEIKVESTPGIGTTFQIFLPIVRKGLPEQNKQSTDRLIKKSPAKQQAKILLVEDDVVLSKMLTFILKRFGYQVEQIYSGDVALNFMEENAASVDAAILDFDLPGKNGWQIARELLDKKNNLKIIMTSGYLLPEIRQKIEQQNGIRLIEKPFEPERLLEELNVMLNAT